MRSDALERHSEKTGPLHRLDARIKLVGALLIVVIITATPIGSWRAFGIEALAVAFLIGLSGIRPRTLFRRWVSFMVLVGFLSVLAAPAHPARSTYGVVSVAISLLAKSSLALLTILVLASVTAFPKLLAGLRQLGMPRLLVATLQLMDRYRHVLSDELERMATARRARTFDRRAGLSWGVLAGMIAMLLLRTLERAERVHGAMVARGWQGAVHDPNDCAIAAPPELGNSDALS
jgi:cobalt/nickel transport system permease protein